MSEKQDPSTTIVTTELLQRAEAYARGDYSLMGKPVHDGDRADQLRLALDVLCAHLQHKDADTSDYIAGLIRSQEAERERVSRELHDDAVQRLIAVGQTIDRAIHESTQPETVAATLTHLRSEVTDLVRGLREVVADLHPPVLKEVGLVAALRMLFASNHSPKVMFMIEDLERRLDPRVALAIYRIAQEAWSNIRRHAFASAVQVNVIFAPDAFRMTIHDDGRGFVPPADGTSPDKPNNEAGWGLRNMRERALMAGGRFQVISAPSEGTTIFVAMPYVEDRAHDPVCGMTVGADAISVHVEGVRYAFCSNACRDLFLSQPDRYAKP